jgi:hypothetical protein
MASTIMESTKVGSFFCSVDIISLLKASGADFRLPRWD